MNRNKVIMALLVMGAATTSLYAQKEVRALTRAGNLLYNNGNFLDSEIAYRKALEMGSNDSLAMYDLGNSLYRQQDENKMMDAMANYIKAARSAVDGGNKKLAAKALYNAGNVMMMKPDYQKAMELYKESLRNDPADDEARYNYLLAKKLLEEQQKQDQQNKDKQDKDKQDQKDKQKQDQQKQDQQKKDDQKKDDQKQDQQNQDQQQQQQQQQQDQQQQQQQQMSPEQAEAILNANNRDEKETQKKVQEMLMQKVQRRKSDKDW